MAVTHLDEQLKVVAANPRVLKMLLRIAKVAVAGTGKSLRKEKPDVKELLDAGGWPVLEALGCSDDGTCISLPANSDELNGACATIQCLVLASERASTEPLAAPSVAPPAASLELPPLPPPLPPHPLETIQCLMLASDERASTEPLAAPSVAPPVASLEPPPLPPPPPPPPLAPLLPGPPPPETLTLELLPPELSQPEPPPHPCPSCHLSSRLPLRSVQAQHDLYISNIMPGGGANKDAFAMVQPAFGAVALGLVPGKIVKVVTSQSNSGTWEIRGAELGGNVAFMCPFGQVSDMPSGRRLQGDIAALARHASGASCVLISLPMPSSRIVGLLRAACDDLVCPDVPIIIVPQSPVGFDVGRTLNKGVGDLSLSVGPRPAASMGVGAPPAATASPFSITMSAGESRQLGMQPTHAWDISHAPSTLLRQSATAKIAAWVVGKPFMSKKISKKLLLSSPVTSETALEVLDIIHSKDLQASFQVRARAGGWG